MTPGVGVVVFVALVFVAAVLLSQGMMVPTISDSARARRRLRARLDEIVSATEADSGGSLLRERYLRELSPLGRALERLPGMRRLGELIEQAGHAWRPHVVVLAALGLCAAGGAASWLATRIGAAALLGALAGLALPFARIAGERRRRLRRFEEQLPEAIDIIARALRAGHPFSATLKLAAEDLQEPVAGEFRRAFADVNYGTDMRRALLGMLARVPSLTLMAFVTAVLVQRETGGNLAEILDQIARVVRGRFRFQRRVRTLSAEGRLSAWVLVLVPFGLFGMLWATTPAYLKVLLGTATGHQLLAIGGTLVVVGVLWIRHVIRIEV